MNTSRSLLCILFVGVALSAGCATAPQAGPASSSPRVSDSAPDKVATQRAAAGLHLEEEDDRWALTAARELPQRKEQKKAQQQHAAGPSPTPSSVDLQRPAAGAPEP